MMGNMIQSFRENKIGIILMVCSACCTSLGQFFWKLSAAQFNLEMIGGFFFYALGAILMIIAFRFGSLSVLHPILSLGYVFGIFLGGLFLHEAITTDVVVGTLLILAGVSLIGGGDH